jgi:hypothetical protein
MFMNHPSFAHLTGNSLQTGTELMEALRQQKARPVLATRVAELDRLQGGGLQRGTFVHLYGERSSGRFAIGLAALSAATQAGEAAALVDVGNHLDPKDAQAAGVHLPRLLWLRPPSGAYALLSVEMVLATGFSVVVLDLSVLRISSVFYPEAAWIRLSNAIVEHKAILLVITEQPLQTTAADIAIHCEGAQPEWLGVEGHRVLSGLSAHVSVRRRKRDYGERSGAILFKTRHGLGG